MVAFFFSVILEIVITLGWSTTQPHRLGHVPCASLRSSIGLVDKRLNSNGGKFHLSNVLYSAKVVKLPFFAVKLVLKEVLFLALFPLLDVLGIAKIEALCFQKSCIDIENASSVKKNQRRLYFFPYSILKIPIFTFQ